MKLCFNSLLSEAEKTAERNKSEAVNCTFEKKIKEVTANE
ncbi:hypothetical protein UF75_1113 [Desulfosporosinus sp. I2]|nr:hypothetical protein UF75_1113 [Desulfosporosinus sp. I2]